MYAITLALLFLTKLTYQWQDGQTADGPWLSMPYEIASAFVRTLCQHYKAMTDARDDYLAYKKDDESETKLMTTKSKEKYESMRKTKKYIVMNSRTCQMACPDWVNRNIHVNHAGIPEMKSGKRGQPWIMVLWFEYHLRSQESSLQLQLTAKGAPGNVRCMEVSTSEEKKKLASLLSGYDFDADDNDEGDVSDAESYATYVGDEAGLEGFVGCGHEVTVLHTNMAISVLRNINMFKSNSFPC